MQLHYLLVEAYDILAWTRNALVNWMLYLYGYWVCHKSFLIHLGESLLFFKTVGTAWATSLLQEPWSQRSSWLVSTPSFKQPYTRRLERFSSQNHCALMNDWFMFKAGPVWRKLKALIVHARRLIFGARFGLCLLLNMKFLSSQFLAQFCTYFFRLFGSWLLEHSETLSTPLFSFEWSRNQSIAFMERTKPDSTIQPYQVLGDRT